MNLYDPIYTYMYVPLVKGDTKIPRKKTGEIYLHTSIRNWRIFPIMTGDEL
jgi:hypothetical protein